jgi:hypothetical protein
MPRRGDHGIQGRRFENKLKTLANSQWLFVAGGISLLAKVVLGGLPSEKRNSSFEIIARRQRGG